MELKLNLHLLLTLHLIQPRTGPFSLTRLPGDLKLQVLQTERERSNHSSVWKRFLVRHILELRSSYLSLLSYSIGSGLTWLCVPRSRSVAFASSDTSIHYSLKKERNTIKLQKEYLKATARLTKTPPRSLERISFEPMIRPLDPCLNGDEVNLPTFSPGKGVKWLIFLLL